MQYQPRVALARRLLKPRSVALIGISPEPGSIGALVYGNLKQFGYAGDIHFVSRSSKQIDGKACIPTVDELPPGIDAAVLAVPAAAVVETVGACARRAIGSAVVFAAGFAEVGGHGKQAQEQLSAAALAGNVGVCGPNCIGYTNFIDGTALTFEPMPVARAGERPAVGIVAQSGAMQTTLRLSLQARGVDVSYAISTGNEADLGAEDFLAFLVSDPHTRVIAMFAEQIRHPQAFLHLARQARTAGKPIVLMHPGRSARAQASALSHTGAMTGDHAVMATLVAREGVVMAQTLEELVDAAELLLRFPEVPTRGVGIVTNSGAFKGYAIDFCDAIGLDVPVIADKTVEVVRAFLPDFAALENPLDTTAMSLRDPTILGRSVGALLEDEAVGSAVAAVIPGPAQVIASRAKAVLCAYDGRKPLAVSVFGDESPLPAELGQIVRDAGACFIRSPDRALRAMARITAYGRALARANERSMLSVPEVAIEGDGALAEYRGKAMLRDLGIAVPPAKLALSVAQAKQAAHSIGYPVVLKAQAAALVHKTEAGGVAIDIADDAALEQAWVRMHEQVARAKPDLRLDGVLVEKMAQPGIEMVVGARRDAAWGPVLLVGLGGIWIEALKDVRLLPPDLTQPQIVEEISQLRGAAVLHGLRGLPPIDIAAVATVVEKLGALMRSRQEISEIDINPLVARQDGVLALDALVVTHR